MAIIHAKDLRRGNTIIYKGQLYLVLDHSFNKTAMRSGIVKCKLKNLNTNAITEEELTGEKLEQAQIDKRKASFSYEDEHTYVFYDVNDFEQIDVAKSDLTWEKNFLVDGVVVSIAIYNEKIIGIELPESVEIEVQSADNAVKGDTVQQAQKKAILVTGWELNVPQFIKSGDKIIVSTIDGKYKSKN